MYKHIIKPILSAFKQETAHDLFLKTVKSTGYIPFARTYIRLTHRHDRPELHRELFGMDFKNPVGLAAGFDTDAYCVDELSNFGFSFIEIGSITPKGQVAGKSDVTRERNSKALVTRLGVRNGGIKNAIANIKKRESQTILLGSIAPNLSSHKDEEIIGDYKRGFSLLYDFVDMMVVNVSCPNENGLLTIQDSNSLADIIDPLLEIRLCYEKHKPILIKVSPDTPFEQLDQMIDYCRLNGVDGVIAGSFAKLQPGMIPASKASGYSFISGEPIFKKNLELVKHIHAHTQGRFPIIGCGGIMSPAQAKEMLDAGACLIQLYSGIFYEGPKLVKHILKTI